MSDVWKKLIDFIVYLVNVGFAWLVVVALIVLILALGAIMLFRILEGRQKNAPLLGLIESNRQAIQAILAATKVSNDGFSALAILTAEISYLAKTVPEELKKLGEKVTSIDLILQRRRSPSRGSKT